MTPSNIVLVITATTTALIAGLFYAWSWSVTPGIGRLSDVEYVRAMQAMNDAILNPVFFATFLGTAVLLPICTYMHYTQPVSTRFWFLLAATIIYLIGVMGVTMGGNVPLNEALKAFDVDGASAQEIAAQRLKFEGPWNGLQGIRAFANFLSIVLVIIACISPKDH